MLSVIKGIVASLLVLINTLLLVPPILILAVIKLLLPWPRLQNLCFTGVRWLASTWVSFNLGFLYALHSTHWDIRGTQQLNKEESLLVICNHQSWVDIPALLVAIHNKTPFFTFFLKRELLWVPFLGLAWWALDYPFMRRYSSQELKRNPKLRGKDLAITRQACQRLQGRKVTLVNYLEGTRFTPAKHASQQSPYQYLLKPKSGGVAFTLNSLPEQLHSYLDVTLVYPGNQPPTFWDLLSGKVARVVIDLRKLPLPKHLRSGDYQQDAVFRAEFQAWINQIWQAKDQRIAQILQELHPTSTQASYNS